ncbi:MAG: cupredoxin domain-containing protein [Actinomycetota bacterium]
MKRVIIVALAALSMGMLTPAHAGNQLIFFAGPEAQVTGWALPEMVIQPGDQITFFNLDSTAQHNFVADSVDAAGNPAPQDIGPDTNSWCTGFLPGHCPIFWSQLTGVPGGHPLQGTVGEPVLGLSSLKPGTYTFYCTEHPNTMIGTLTVLSS